MSRIGKQPVKISPEVKITIDGRNIKIGGPKGELAIRLTRNVAIEQADSSLILKPANDSRRAKQQWGLYRTLVNNMVLGVNEGFSKQLEIHGVGYRVQGADNKLTFALGFSHPIEFKLPEGIEAKIEANIVTISGIDKQKVGQVAAEIRKLRPPEPYKGKGIRYVGEHVRRKAGKAAATKAVGS